MKPTLLFIPSNSFGFTDKVFTSIRDFKLLPAPSFVSTKAKNVLSTSHASLSLEVHYCVL